MSNWMPIDGAYEAYKSGQLRECEAILTQHEEDLYPVTAYLLDLKDRTSWYRQTEGPEDLNIPGRNEPLHRTPTHYMPLPTGPGKGE